MADTEKENSGKGSKKMRLLIIEDDVELSEAVAVSLKAEGYQVDLCHSGADAAYYYEKNIYDAVLLDRMLPEKDGIEILNDMRHAGYEVPVIMITALGDVEARIGGLDAGADDYLAKPFSVSELQARLRALFRRPRKMENTGNHSLGNTTLSMGKLQLESDKGCVTISKKEAAFLEFFFCHPGQILQREQILDRVWGTDKFVEDGNVDTYIHFVRRRLSSVNSNLAIKNVHGVGYRLEAPQAKRD